MSKYKIIIAPDPILKKSADPVESVNAETAKLMEDMLEIMYEAPGIGLAAPQIGLSTRVIVMDISHDDDDPQPIRMANPEIIWASEDKTVQEEGCLSLPGQAGDVERPAEIKVRYLDENNEQKELAADGLLARCIQHEIDHLDGILFIDHLSRLKRDMILKRMKKIKRTEKM